VNVSVSHRVISFFDWRITGNASTSRESASEKLKIMRSAIETRAQRLCDALTRIGLPIKPSECVEVLLKLEPDSASNQQLSHSNVDERRAEQFANELLEGMYELDYAKFTRLFETKFLVHNPEVDFSRKIQDEIDKLGAYRGREFMGSVVATKRAGDDRYPDLVRYIWRCVFEKNEALLRIGIYQKAGAHYVSGFHFI